MKSIRLHISWLSFLVSLTATIGFEITYLNITYPALGIPITPADDGTATRITPNGNRLDIRGMMEILV